MLAHALVLHLALLDPAAAPGIRVLPRLEIAAPLPALAQAGDPGALAPAEEGATMVARAEPRRASVLAGYGGALAGTVVADLAFTGLVVVGVEGWAEHGGLFARDGGSGWFTLAVAGMTGLVFVTPAVAVFGAQKTTGRRGLGGAAYAAAFAIRLAGALLAARAPALFVATELVAAPLAVGAIVAGGSPFELRVTPPPDFPDEPVPLPGPAGPRSSRPICPDAALALR